MGSHRHIYCQKLHTAEIQHGGGRDFEIS